MASIVKRKNRYSVVYTYTDESGAKRPPGGSRPARAGGGKEPALPNSGDGRVYFDNQVTAGGAV